MKKALLLSTILISSIAYTQTKTIAHKRHSGSKSSFSMALHLEGLDGGASNLGQAPIEWVRNSELKKVIFINDSTQAMVTEETCQNRRIIRQNPQQEQEQSDVWRAGTDTVKKHPLFSSGVSVDSMRTILKADYYFANDMKDVEFVGFEKREATKSKNQHIQNEEIKTPTEKVEQKKSQKSGFGKYGWLLVVFASSMGIGLINIR